MNDNILGILIPSQVHIDELKSKGFDIELELTRIVYDNLKLIKDGKNPRKISIAVSKAQLDELQDYGLNGEECLASSFKNELELMIREEK